jgi:hypothetical protein
MVTGGVLEHGEELEAHWVDECIGWVCRRETEDRKCDWDDREAEDDDEDVALLFVDVQLPKQRKRDEHHFARLH